MKTPLPRSRRPVLELHACPLTGEAKITNPDRRVQDAVIPQQAVLPTARAMSRAARAHKPTGFLLNARVSLKTQRLYQTHAVKFDKWRESEGHTLKGRSLDSLVVMFLEELFMKKRPVHTARCTVFGLIFRSQGSVKDPSVLPLARLSLRGWGRLRPEVSRDPIPWVIVTLIVSRLLQGNDVQKEAGKAALIQFDSYCRPGEIVGLRLINVVPPARNAPQQYRRLALLIAPTELLKTTKTGQRDDSVMMAEGTPHRAFVVNVLAKQFKQQAAKTDSQMAPLFPLLTLAKYAKAFGEAAKSVGVGHLRFTPHSLRHGGPSTDVYEGKRGLAEVQKRGRWASPLSVARYEKHARLLRVFSKINKDVLEEARISSSVVIKAVLNQ